MMKTRLLRLGVMLLSLWVVSCSTPQQKTDDQTPDDQKSAEAQKEDGDQAAKGPETKTAEGTDSDILPLGDSPVLGKADAPVTIVAFSDFQCPYCNKGARTMHKLVEKYPNDVRVVFKHYPLPFHQQADEAAKAAIAAGEQGRFWEMHDWLFENQKQFRSHANDFEEWTSEQAKKMGLDPVQFHGDFEAAGTQAKLDEDMKLAKEVGVRGTPNFYVNGEVVRGAKPMAAFEEVVERKIKQAADMQRKEDISRADIYAETVKVNYKKKPVRKPPRRKKPKTLVSYVPVEADDPVMGNTKDPLVTIVEFSDFQCPYCAKAVPTVHKIKKEYGDQVRIVFKQLPLAMHAQAEPAARAALAANEQGKFWEMHDKLFEKQKEMRNHASDFKDWSAGLAKELGLDVDQFKKDYDSDEIAQKVQEDLALAKKVSARGTPNFWINGVNLRGAQPFAEFKSAIDTQIERAKELRDEKNLSGDALYKAAVDVNEKKIPQAEAKPQKPSNQVDTSKLSLKNAPTMGPQTAPVTIVAFSDFQCPYCQRGAKNLDRAMSKFSGDVRVVFKHYPLPFHKQAKEAAKAAMAAGEQGKFWEMHDLLFENQKSFRHEGIFVELASQLGLNMAQFKEDMKNTEYDKIIRRDMTEGQAIGVRGTPSFVINGKRVVGAQPVSRFEKEIKEALEAAK